MPTIEELAKKSNRIVVFSGAGFSTESNIPDFRSDNGIYKQNKWPYPAEVMLSHSFYESNPEQFFDFYFKEMIYPDAQPNRGHQALARLEKLGKLEAIVTQNIDGLHQKAGNKKVFELHGSVLRNYCTRCGEFYSLEAIMNKGVPHCHCGGIIKPDVVLYEEGLDTQTVEGAIKAISNADLLIVAGTSLVVYPAAGMIDYYRGKEIIVINHDATKADQRATIVSHRNIGEELDFINNWK